MTQQSRDMTSNGKWKVRPHHQPGWHERELRMAVLKFWEAHPNAPHNELMRHLETTSPRLWRLLGRTERERSCRVRDLSRALLLWKTRYNNRPPAKKGRQR